VQPLVQELEIEADYGQIYIYDPATQLPNPDVTEDDDPLQRAMEDGYMQWPTRSSASSCKRIPPSTREAGPS
jgi:hypothetical protein